MDESDSYLGAIPPVQVNAQQCGSVKIEVKFITETRDHDTLRRWADLIDRILDHNGVKRIVGCIAIMALCGDWI